MRTASSMNVIAGGRARQLAWRGDWQAAAVRTPYGWSAEIAIPISSLNFEQGATALGINFLRYHHRTSEWSRWADVTVRALPEEMGRLTGLTMTPGKPQPWTLMPYVLAGRQLRDKHGELRSFLVNAGAELRYQPRPNLTGVLSLNPDFSQVESAITDINFDYNEKFLEDPRPFFQEGAAYFGNTAEYFYSNRIPDFDYGAKFFTRTSGYQLGALATKAPQGRADYVIRLEREFDATHSVGGMVVQTDRPDLRNSLYVIRGQGRESSGLFYALDAALTQTELQPGDGSRLFGNLGWTRDFLTVGIDADRYTVNYRPANALLDSDLPDTRGFLPFVIYLRDLGEGPVRQLRGDLSYTERFTGDGRVQRQMWYAGGSVESRNQMRVKLEYRQGIYRPVGAEPGSWSSVVNHDNYWTAGLHLNTRSSRLRYGASRSEGSRGGDDYQYTSAYILSRPTATTFVNATTEYLSNFGHFRQTVVSAGWDIHPRHSILGRYITAYYGKAYRLGYLGQLSKNVDFFLLYDHAPAERASISAKIVMTFQ